MKKHLQGLTSKMVIVISAFADSWFCVSDPCTQK
jgi:hypothetical protein